MPLKKFEKLKKTFRNDQQNRARYNELRPILTQYLADVAAILADLNSDPNLAGTVNPLENRRDGLSQGGDDADQTLTNNQVSEAISDLIVYVSSGEALRKECHTTRNRILKETARQAIRRIDTMRQSGLQDVQPMKQAINTRMRHINELAKRPQVAHAYQALTAFLQPLGQLEAVLHDVVMLTATLPNNVDEQSQNELGAARGLVYAEITAFNVQNATTRKDEYSALVGNVIHASRPQQAQELVRMVDPTARYQRLRIRIEDILDFPDEYCSVAVLQQKTNVRDAQRTYLQREQEFIQARDNAANNQQQNQQRNLDNLARTASEQANAALKLLSSALNTAVKPISTHKNLMMKYYVALKELRSDVDFADGLVRTELDSNSLWQVQLQTYSELRGQIKLLVDPPARDYATALPLLDALRDAITDLKSERVKALQKTIDLVTNPETGSAPKTCQLVMNLARTPGLLRVMEPEQQLALLQSLRSQTILCRSCGKASGPDDYQQTKGKCPFCNSTDLDAPMQCSNTKCQKAGNFSSTNRCPGCKGQKSELCTRMSGFQLHNPKEKSPVYDLVVARATLLAEMELTPEFKEFDQQQRHNLAQTIGQDPEFLEAQRKWSDWVKNKDYRTIGKFLQHLVTKQCEVMGHTHQDLQRTVIDDNLEDKVETFKKGPVKIKLHRDNESKDTTGSCEPGYPTQIKVNIASVGLESFIDIVDTVLHENTHAWQQMITAKLRMDPPFTNKDRDEVLNDPKLARQARLFLENEKAYYHGSSLRGEQTRVLNNRAYRNQPVEEHAWTVGGLVSRSLSAPPDIQSLASKRMQRQVFIVASVDREADAYITVRGPHGFREQEAGQESVVGLRATLTGVLRNNQSQTLQFTLAGLFDNSTFETDLDMSDYDADPQENDEVKLQGARLTIDRTPRDL
ncbi:MAG: hypothetical protein H6739_38670 [Alphaproteobacteria bacterium]|nr:hypothetical protein [Alphaproteobacteria bacterium]